MSKVTTWRRLEPRVRQWDMRTQLSAGVLDPGWLLARQWQMGEFLGQDLGTPIDVYLDVQVAELNRFKTAHLADTQTFPNDYDSHTRPLDMLIERERHVSDVDEDPLWMAQAVDVLWSMLHDQTSDQSVVEAYRTHWRELLGKLTPTPDQLDDPHNALLAELAQELGLLDGQALASELRETLATVGSIFPGSELLLDSADSALITQVANSWLNWLETHLEQHQEGAWKPETLRHEFSVSATDASRDYVFEGTHRKGKLDWYSFDLKGDAQSTNATLGGTAQTQAIQGNFIPTSIQFPGMPESRFWEMEDGQVSLAGVQARTTQIARNLWMEFMLVFSDQWWVVPLEVNTPGAVLKVEQMSVTDTFGVTRTLSPMAQQSQNFRLFDAHRPDDSQSTYEQVMLKAPVITEPRQHGNLERVSLVQDEAANLAWAIEHEVLGRMGRRLERAHEQGGPEEVLPGGEGLGYQLSTSVPPYWYPLVPRARGEFDAEVILEHGALLTPVPEQHADPISKILEEPVPYELPAHVIPRQGLELRRNTYMARWYGDTSALSWRGKSQRLGGWPGASGLDFDLLVQGTDEPAEPIEIYEEPEGVQMVSASYPWSVWSMFVLDDVNMVMTSMRGVPAQIVDNSPEMIDVGMAAGSPTCIAMRGDGHLAWLREDLDVDYVHKFGVFSIMMIVSRDPRSGSTTLCATTSDVATPGFRMRYDESMRRLICEISNGTDWLTLTSTYDPFFAGEFAHLTFTSDGATLSLWNRDRLIGQQPFGTWEPVLVDGQQLIIGGDGTPGTRFEGCVGGFGAMPGALNEQDVREMVHTLHPVRDAPGVGLLHLDAANPLTMFADVAGTQYVENDESIARLEPLGSLGVKFDIITGPDSGSTTPLRVSDKIEFAPSAGATHHGFAGALESPLELPESTWILYWDQNLGEEGTICGAPITVGGDPALGLECALDSTGTQLIMTERGFTQTVDLGAFTPFQLAAIRLTAEGMMEVWTSITPEPAYTLRRPGFSFEGTWDTDYGELRLHQKDDVVWGDYKHVGIIEGRINPTTGDLEGIYTNGPSQGRIRFTLVDGRFEGLWASGTNEPGLTWDGDLVSMQTPVLTSWTPQTITRAPSYEGTWSSSYGELRLHQEDDVVWGDYGTVGIIQGRVDAATGVLEGIFTNGSNEGRIRFELSTEGTFEGTWTYNPTGPLTGNWDGTRSSTATPALTQWSGTDPSFQGTWSSTFGTLRLKQGGTRVWGDYKNVGFIEGDVDLSTGVLEGTYTNGGSQGRIRFTHTGSSFDGLWAPGTNEPNSNWDGTLTSSTLPTLLTWPAYGLTLLAQSFEGTWTSTRGVLRLKQGGTRVWGDIEDTTQTGTLEGELDLDTNILTGTYTYGSETGTLRFMMNDAQIEGLYGVGSVNPSQNWDATQTTEDTPTLTEWQFPTPPASHLHVHELLLGTARRTSAPSWTGNLGTLWVWDTALSPTKIYEACHYIHAQRWKNL